MENETIKEIPLEEVQGIIDEFENSKTLLHGLNVARTIEMLPDDLGAFVQKINDTLPDDYAGACEKLTELSKTDPEFFNQIIMFQMLSNDLKFEKPEVKKLSEDELNSAK